MLGEPMQRLFRELREGAAAAPEAAQGGESMINVHKLTERAGTFYEKLRYLIDYKEERHIRRSAIERVVKRKLFFEEAKEDGLGLSLIQELIAGGYLANNSIPEGAAALVERIIHKFRALERSWPADFRGSPRARRFLGSLLGSEIEAYFYPRFADDVTARAFEDSVRGSLQLDPGVVSDDAFHAQTLLACYRSLHMADNETMRFVFWNRVYPEWRQADEAGAAAIAESSPRTIAGIEAALRHPLGYRLVPKLATQAIFFSVIHEVIRAYGVEAEQVLQKPELVEQFAREFLGKQYRKARRKTRENSVRAVLYIFVTKMLVALALEVPYALYIIGVHAYLPIVLNVVIHPFLLFVATFFTTPLGERNTRAVIAGIGRIVAGDALPPVRIKAREGGILQFVFLTAYAALFLAVFAALVLGLRLLQFDLANIALFLLFLALVSFFALRIRLSANKWRVPEADDCLSLLAFNVLILPVIRAGRFLSRTFSSINIFVFVLDFLIETPFKFLLKFSDAFVVFLREKQEDMY